MDDAFGDEAVAVHEPGLIGALASRAACLASTFGSSAVDLMSTRAQRFSGTVITLTPVAALASALAEIERRAVTTTPGCTGVVGKAWSRRATPRLICR